MKILSICGSRNPNGQTAQAADALRRGAEKAGFLSEQVFLPTQKIERCRQCNDDGWGLCVKKGRCVIDDDFSDIVEKIRQADVVVFATPVYYADLSESMRAFADRLRRVCTQDKSIKGKPAIGVCVASSGRGLKCCVSLEFVMSECGLDVVDMIPARQRNLEAKLERFELAGQWLASLA